MIIIPILLYKYMYVHRLGYKGEGVTVSTQDIVSAMYDNCTHEWGQVCVLSFEYRSGYSDFVGLQPANKIRVRGG